MKQNFDKFRDLWNTTGRIFINFHTITPQRSPVSSKRIGYIQMGEARFTDNSHFILMEIFN